MSDLISHVPNEQGGGLRRIHYTLIILIALALLSGCGGIKTIKPEYMSNFHATQLFEGQNQTVTLNAFYDDRNPSDRIGEGFNAYGGKIETWVAENEPLAVVENALEEQLKSCGFTVIKVKGWNYDPNAIPEQVKTKLIVGGKLRTFWVESRPGFWTVAVSSKVCFDLYIADAMDKKSLYTGQFTGASQSDHGYRGSEDMQNSLSLSLSQAVNKTFQDETVRGILLKCKQ